MPTAQKKDETITKDTKVTVGVIITVAAVILFPAIGTYMTMSSSLHDVKLELATGFSRLSSDVQHNTEQLRHVTERLNGYDGMRAEIAALSARIKVLEGKE